MVETRVVLVQGGHQGSLLFSIRRSVILDGVQNRVRACRKKVL